MRRKVFTQSVEAKGAEGYNPVEFRSGYTLVRIRNDALELDYRITGEEVKVSKILLFRCS